jgi:hypothetical protein
MAIEGKHMTDPTNQRPHVPVAVLAFIVFTAGTALSACGTTKPAADGTPPAATAEPQATPESSAGQVAEGQRVFRFETFADEQLWTDTLRLNEVVEKNVDPTTALKVGLKVDADVLPAGILEKVDLKSPATTVALLKMNAVVGLQATVDANNHITRLGVTCALCHSTVDNSVMAGIGHRKDGWPNHDLNVGAIIALSPALAADKKAVYQSWGPGKYDPRYNQDGKNTPLVLPPAYGLAQIKKRNLHRGGTDLLLECLCRRHADGRARQLLRPAARDRRQALAGHGDLQAPGAARLPAQSAGASASGRKLRCGDCRAWTRGV